MFTPVNTISLTPELEIDFAASIILLSLSLLDIPLAKGIVQYVHL